MGPQGGTWGFHLVLAAPSWWGWLEEMDILRVSANVLPVFVDVEDFFQKNDYLSKFAGEKRKGGRKKLR